MIHAVLSRRMRKLLPASRHAHPTVKAINDCGTQILNVIFVVKKRKSLLVAWECYASAQQADFQNGFPGVTKPEGSLPSWSSHSRPSIVGQAHTLNLLEDSSPGSTACTGQQLELCALRAIALYCLWHWVPGGHFNWYIKPLFPTATKTTFNSTHFWHHERTTNNVSSYFISYYLVYVAYIIGWHNIWKCFLNALNTLIIVVISVGYCSQSSCKQVIG